MEPLKILTLDPETTAFISDTHIGHANIIEYCARPYRTVEGMDNWLIRQMFAADKLGYTIIHLGDVHFGASRILPPLPGQERHKLIPGNHDYNGFDRYKPWFGEIIGRPDKWATNFVEAHIGGNVVALSHGPLEPTKEMVNKYQLNLHGHVHNRSLPDNWHVNCSVEVIDYRPITWFDLLRR